MSEREDFLQYFRRVFIELVERLETMTEGQVLDSLLEVKAVRGLWQEEFTQRIKKVSNDEPWGGPHITSRGHATGEGRADLGAIQAFFNSVYQLNARAGAKARPLGALPSAMDSLEDALKERLEWLRKGPSRDL